MTLNNIRERLDTIEADNLSRRYRTVVKKLVSCLIDIIKDGKEPSKDRVKALGMLRTLLKTV